MFSGTVSGAQQDIDLLNAAIKAKVEELNRQRFREHLFGEVGKAGDYPLPPDAPGN